MMTSVMFTFWCGFKNCSCLYRESLVLDFDLVSSRVIMTRLDENPPGTVTELGGEDVYVGVDFATETDDVVSTRCGGGPSGQPTIVFVFVSKWLFTTPKYDYLNSNPRRSEDKTVIARFMAFTASFVPHSRMFTPSVDNKIVPRSRSVPNPAATCKSCSFRADNCSTGNTRKP
ncbi:hypothetical protein PsorP6_000659 [Peronosclerospora sorghi]|uniref:Uncharacterized protein n=1 Tax=Peronosclerospora sorghi TaxID=230839 RepID=A0ACC0WQT6_9STRA|nr:hypothetical protein PsorP6_000659 [Peronosclerospora sorghi]